MQLLFHAILTVDSDDFSNSIHWLLFVCFRCGLGIEILWRQNSIGMGVFSKSFRIYTVSMVHRVVHTHRIYSSGHTDQKKRCCSDIWEHPGRKTLCFLQALNRSRDWIASLQRPEFFTFGTFGIYIGYSCIIGHGTSTIRKRLLFCIVNIIYILFLVASLYVLKNVQHYVRARTKTLPREIRN